MVIIQNVADTVRNTFNFGIDKFKLQGPDNLATPFYGLFRSDNAKCVGNAVSDRYTPHTTEDVVTLVEAAEAAFDIASVQCYFRDGHYVVVEPTKDHRVQIHGTEDAVFPRVIIRAGYDGQAFKACVGWFRDVCSNMSMMESVSDTSVSIRHTNSLTDKVDDLKKSFSQLQKGWAFQLDLMNRMQEAKVSAHDFLFDVYPIKEDATDRQKNSHRKLIGELFERIVEESDKIKTVKPRKETNWETSVWECFNAVQGHVQHAKTRHGDPSKFDRILKAFSDADVKRAEKQALTLIGA